MTVTTETLGPIGKCECGSESFYVNATVQSHAPIYSRDAESAAREGFPEGIFVDGGDLPGNTQFSSAVFETGRDVIQKGELNSLPDRILESGANEVDLDRYVVVRCMECGRPFDYGDRKVVLD